MWRALSSRSGAAVKGRVPDGASEWRTGRPGGGRGECISPPTPVCSQAYPIDLTVRLLRRGAGMKRAVLLAVLLSSAIARAEQTPRSGLLGGFGIGLDLFRSKWFQPNSLYPDRVWEAALTMRGRFGFSPVERVGLFSELYLGIPIHPLLDGLWLTGIGAGAIVHGNPWHVIVLGRWGGAGLPRPTLPLDPPPVIDFDIWTIEVGIGHTSRPGRVDHDWTVSFFGGAMTSSGWLGGLSLCRAWSRT
jgi:hypothetical protein